MVTRRALVLSAFAGSVLTATTVGIVVLADHGRWDPALLALLGILVVGAIFVEFEFHSVSISGDFLGFVIAMALLGPSQAAVLALLSTTVWLARGRTRLPLVLNSLAGPAAGALAGGIVMEAVATASGSAPTEGSFVVALLAGFVVANVINIVIAFGGAHVLDRAPFWGSIRSVVVPVVPSEAAMVLLASMIVYAEAHLGPVALGMLIALFFLYVYLLRALVLSQRRGEELVKRTEELAALQVGVLTAMLRTLSMRDRMTARHSAAVARYARELAKAAGCTKEEQDLVHTAGLLHDIGKFILPDHILLADTKLSEEDWGLIKMHPYQGAKVVREVEGYGPVADIIWAHHERIDGRGYPRGLEGEEIPRFSRMISIADTYDVMTSRDSYRDPVSSADAIEELRRVSGKQLDGELVEIFITMLQSKGVAFRHADDADFEAELAFDSRVRDHAAPRPLPVAA